MTPPSRVEVDWADARRHALRAFDQLAAATARLNPDRAADAAFVAEILDPALGHLDRFVNWKDPQGLPTVIVTYGPSTEPAPWNKPTNPRPPASPGKP